MKTSPRSLAMVNIMVNYKYREGIRNTVRLNWERPSTMVLESDRELVESCRQGAPDAFRALFERYKDLVYSIALRYSGDDASAQDITQDTFLKVYVNLAKFRGECEFKSWIYRLAVNSCLDQKRRRSRLMPLLDEALAMIQSPDLSALDDVLQTELSTHVKEVVASLHDEHRMLIVLRYTESLSYDDIAAILGCSSGTVASRLNRVHRVLARRLARML